MTIDLHNEEGRQLVRQLADKVDVLVENFRPGVMEKWQVGILGRLLLAGRVGRAARLGSLEAGLPGPK